MHGISIREADFARDKPAFLDFIMGSQRYEYAIAPNRGLDPPVAEEHWARLSTHLSEQGGCVFLAEDARKVPLGWGVVGGYTGEVFVVPSAVITMVAVADPSYVITSRRSFVVGVPPASVTVALICRTTFPAVG